MREKHCPFSIFVFTVTTALLLGFFMLATPQVFADNGYKGNYKHKEWQKERSKQYQTHQEVMKRESRKHREVMEQKNRKHYKEQSRFSYKKHPDYHKYRGYSASPYNKHRHYMKYKYKEHRYYYHGHWRSWEQWDRYAKKHPNIYKNGRYYRENAHLMFRFCEPGTSNCFFFSIGR
jgi:hypothetical protein